MPKVKTRKSLARRFRVTTRGKVLHRLGFGRHLRRSKSASQKRRYRQVQGLSGRMAIKIKRLMHV